MSQQPNNQELVSSVFGRRIIWLTTLGITFYLAWSEQHLLLNED